MDLLTALCSIGYAHCSAAEIYNSSSADQLHKKISLIKNTIDKDHSIPEAEKEALKLCFDAIEDMIKKQRGWSI